MSACIARGCSYFLSGVMQGSVKDKDDAALSDVHGIRVAPQDYRAQLKDAILGADPSAKIIEPWELVGGLCAEMYPPGTPQEDYFADDAHVQRAFQLCVDRAAQADVVVSYLPEASMGSAVEIHAARQAGKKVITIAMGRMASNWVVRSYSDHKLSSIAGLKEWLASNLAPE
mmetsp:Transcript_34183/g.102022  ORF Transcript_34183/g.102022 Transcript_34183/m.102022 type:complete len:172 (-) Transcript_34183:171-686(-)|eukprot:CAMPEP_0175240476 /NCGR_PEP_ID=MMETSP0093-20121207/30073_1 /TAXON_ID=311494 /ORGANISM="Alexandrium monilatum, Strain CCMP3105" /LENGTH=171 /DNA_ID=CAMNT_0016534523 /DNA_START=60 /DNA_END=575 /DNA_ORIENTATION=+